MWICLQVGGTMDQYLRHLLALQVEYIGLESHQAASTTSFINTSYLQELLKMRLEQKSQQVLGQLGRVILLHDAHDH
jgi:hypothetical protein